ncbi:response regulator transcription factor [Pseudactinotalea suaedae]
MPVTAYHATPNRLLLGDTGVSRKGARMRVLVMGRSPFLVRGLSAELVDRGVAVVATVRTLGELGATLATATVDAVLACLSGGAISDARGGAVAITSVLSEHPTTALLALTPLPPRSRLWQDANPAWGAIALESADTDALMAALDRLTSAPAARRIARADLTLTGSEQRVLDLLAVGLSNDAIAQQLCLSPKTVEAHISRAFSKLGLVNDDHRTNRRVLAALRWTGG